MLDALIDAVKDTLKLLPILYITYLFMEYLEHKAGEKMKLRLEKSKKAGPVFGAAFGLLPQCGFSGAAASFYASGAVTIGTLLAVFIATSDEMLPIFLSSRLPASTIVAILAAKFFAGLLIGYAADFLLRKKKIPHDFHEICETEHCHCEENLLLSALKHTIKISILVFLVTLLLNFAFLLLPEQAIAAVWKVPVAAEFLSALIGLIPNCSASILLSNLYINGVCRLPVLLSGLISNAGVGLLVLFRVNKNIRENLLITIALFLMGLLLGGPLGLLLEIFLKV